ncbi:MAG: prenyltransferase [Bacteroidaceae bacterium]|nr:prenyltransferase [Bacteroidaceae bacterium]MBQ9170777.1 prenyltransferase [Bacteroidaceae bacterium]MBQ9294714.1 prenyltransferase [Bacteroidaceae bacterium]
MKNHTIKEWVLATRPWSFPASTMPVLVAMMFLWAEGHEVTWWLGIMALVNIVLVHAAGNVWSDYHDYKRGVDAPDTYGVRILTDGLFTPREVFSLSVTLQVAAIFMGLLMVWLTGITLLWLGLAGIALSLLYPPLKYMALGDLVIMACYALLPMLGTTFICSGNIVPEVLWLAVPVGSITVAILHVNNARDIETDRRAGIRTFALLTGRAAAIRVYLFELTLPYCWLLVTSVQGHVSLWTLLTLITLPLALGNCRKMLSCKKKGIEAIAKLDEATAQLQLAFSLTLAIGLIIEALT